MKKLLLSLGLLLGLTAIAAAQCISVGGVNNVPQPGVVCLSEPIAPTYAATSVALVPVAAGATDFFCLTGSATKIVRLQSIKVGGTATTAVMVPVLLMKHASANTGAASATGTQIPIPYALNSTDSAATATTSAWITANPTIVDAAPGIIDSSNLPLALPGTITGNAPSVVFDYSRRDYSEAPTLRGVAQQLCLNLNTTAVTAGLLYITARWTELAQ